ncbi:hypothetical protein HPB52_010441 [Rhipicephalus sanguineus]|uniref:Uncharacterized protein n=1 Tax=Rhipicephalus sanguineus TaxID=34632 RepID=A0A9D4T5K4_RHISA|nr:hypothetical protein HPB52_010441 [Rhipicephalus sanguineus]
MWESVVLSPSVAHILATLPQRRAISCDDIVSSFSALPLSGPLQLRQFVQPRHNLTWSCPQLISSARTTGSMQQWRHRVHGFGSHVEMKTVEFVEKLERWQTVCLKCGDTVAHKDMRLHYPGCGGRPGAFLRSAEARCLLDNLSAACEKLEQAVASAGPYESATLRDTVNLVREQFTRIRGQLAAGVPWHLKNCCLLRLGK